MAVPVQAQEATLAAINPISIFSLPALFPRGGHLHWDWVPQAARKSGNTTFSKSGISVPWNLQQLHCSSNPHSYYSTPIAGKRPCGYTAHLPVSAGSLFSTCITQSQHLLSQRNNESSILRTCVLVRPDPILSLFLSLSEQRLEAWCFFVKYVEISHQGTTMVSMHVKAAR